jgi:short-subunit dehydrogenase
MRFRERFGQWALVAGASEGLGAAFASQLAAQGLNLLLLARRKPALDALADELRKRHEVQVETFQVDLGAADLAATVAAVVAGREVGVLVCNAAVSPMGPFHELPAEQHLRALDVNCRSPLLLLHALVPAMIERRRGAVILMSSLTAFQGSPLISVYGATKAFNLALAEGLWDELRPHGVDVLACCAGATRTPNYLRTRAEGGAPGEQDPEDVAREALAALGRGPVLIPGRFNRFASFLLRRVLPRRATVALMGQQTRKLQRPLLPR